MGSLSLGEGEGRGEGGAGYDERLASSSAQRE